MLMSNNRELQTFYFCYQQPVFRIRENYSRIR
jgi:hypothetical protein